MFRSKEYKLLTAKVHSFKYTNITVQILFNVLQTKEKDTHFKKNI